MKRKGQVSVFIIIGIVIVALVGLVLFFTSTSKGDVPPPSASNEFDEYFRFYQSCLNKNAEGTVIETALNGGYYEKPAMSVNILFNDYPYYLDKGKEYFPTRTVIESELSKMMVVYADECFNSLKEVIPSGYILEKGETKVTAKITANSVQFDITSPVTIGRESKKRTKEGYKTTVSARIDEIYNAIEEFITLQKQNSEGLCWTCLSTVAEKYDLKIETEVYDKDTIIFSFVQEKSNYQVKWLFANRY
jgi:hypothetical protein